MNDPEVTMSNVLAKSDLVAHSKALEAAGAAIIDHDGTRMNAWDLYRFSADKQSRCFGSPPRIQHFCVEPFGDSGIETGQPSILHIAQRQLITWDPKHTEFIPYESRDLAAGLFGFFSDTGEGTDSILVRMLLFSGIV